MKAIRKPIATGSGTQYIQDANGFPKRYTREQAQRLADKDAAKSRMTNARGFIFENAFHFRISIGGKV